MTGLSLEQHFRRDPKIGRPGRSADNAPVNCVFCDLLDTDTGTATWLTREPHAVAFLPLPANSPAPGHTLVVQREHCAGVLDASDEAPHYTITLVRRVGGAMTRALGATGVNVLNTSGPALNAP